VVNHILQFKEYNPFMRGIVAWIGFKETFIPYDRDERFAGKSKFFILGKKVISNFLSSAVVSFSSVPLMIASYGGLLALFMDFVFTVHVIYQKSSGQAIPGWSALMIAILFIGGVQLFCLGMIGLYLNSVHEQTKMRPNYIVSSTYGFPAKT
jgi:dolichol-phosphate mannosyltransferase